MSEHRLSEIVIERPRWGMRISSTKMTGYHKELDRITREATEDGLLSPYRIKVRRRSKWPSDNLGPLKGFLRSHLNQPWSHVYSRLCHELDPRTMAGQHVIDHLWDFVVLHVEMIDGFPHSKPNNWLYGGYRPLIGGYRQQFYVHPDSGLLCSVPPRCHVHRNLHRTPPRPKDTVSIDADSEYQKINDLWYRITFEKLSPYPVWDVLLKDTIDGKKARWNYGRPVYAVKKRQCGKRELKIIRKEIG